MACKPPVFPNDFKQTIPSASGSNFCDTFLNALNLPNLVYQIISFIWNEDGTFTDDFKCSICGLGVGDPDDPGNPPIGQLPAPIVSATDGAYADKIQITWTFVAGATLYDLYRHNVNEPNNASLLAHDLTTGIYEDLTVIPGQYYYYWMKARNASQTSNFSQGDRGHAGTIATTLAAVTDLTASRGFSDGLTDPKVSLVWTKVAGAETYDVYRNTVDDFTTSLQVMSNRAPFNRELTLTSGPTPTFVDNNTEVVYIDPVPAGTAGTHYFYWVIARRGGPPVQSLPSNSAMGWSQGFSDSNPGVVGTDLQSNLPYTIPVGLTKIHFVFKTMGGAGAGGSNAFGGGGGGAGATVVGEYTLAGVVGGASKLRVIHTPESSTPTTPNSTNGDDASVAKLQYSVIGDFSDAIDIATATAAQGGDFNALGGGAGGAGGGATVDGAVTQSVIYNGRNGLPGVGNKGGRGGNAFGGFLNNAAHFSGYLGGGYGGDSVGSSGGGGSYSSPAAINLATGGSARRVNTIVQLRT